MTVQPEPEHDDVHVCDDNGIRCDGEWWDCVDGRLWGPCEDERCGGVCEYKGDCRCTCHTGQAEPSRPNPPTEEIK